MDRWASMVRLHCKVLARSLHKVPRSQSRMKGDFLFYEEKIETTEEERMAKAARR